MIYLSKDNRKRGQKSFWMIAGGFLFLLLFILAALLPGFFSSLVQSVGRPLWQLKNSVIGSDSNLKNQQSEELQSKDMEREVLMTENNELKAILGRKDENTNLVLGAILTRPPDSPYDTFVIDIGDDHKLTLGSLVFSHGDIAVGRISAVFLHTSVVKLLSGGGEKHQVLVGTSTIAAEAVGLGGQNYSITVPVGTAISIGDGVILPGIHPILLGTVEKIDIKTNDSFMKVLFKMPINFRNLLYAEVETSK